MTDTPAPPVKIAIVAKARAWATWAISALKASLLALVKEPAVWVATGLLSALAFWAGEVASSQHIIVAAAPVAATVDLQPIKQLLVMVLDRLDALDVKLSTHKTSTPDVEYDTPLKKDPLPSAPAPAKPARKKVAAPNVFGWP